MLKIISVGLCLLLTSNVLTANAVTIDQVIVSPQVKTTKTINQIIDEKALQYGVSAERVHYIIEKESQYNPNAIGDMNIICKRTGLPVRARGILQITECYYPEISDACTFDVECSLDKMLPVMKDDKKCLSQWSTCKEEILQKLG